MSDYWVAAVTVAMDPVVAVVVHLTEQYCIHQPHFLPACVCFMLSSREDV